MVTQTYVNNEHQHIFEQTKHIPGWQVIGDSEKLYELAYAYGDVILEIGTFGGRSATVELRGALANAERNTPPQFYGLDIDIQGIWRTLTSLAEENLSSHALLYHGNLQSFIEAFPINPTMVFVDGDHRYEGVKRDLMSLSGFLAPGTPVLCHDYTNPENDTGELGVRQAIDEFVAEGFATFSGTFGCSAFLIMSGKAQGPLQEPLSPQEFYQRRADLLVSYSLDMQSRWHNSEGDRQARGALIGQLQQRLGEQQRMIEQRGTQQVSPAEVEVQPTPNQQVAAPLHDFSHESSQNYSANANQSVAELKQKLTQTRSKLRESRQRDQQARQELDLLKGQIAAMKTSKFWKLRSLWCRLKSPFIKAPNNS
ncbi:MAG: class I SAM-dependent methyltransferase [Elainellaceae cyanobacterium]